MPLVRRPDYPTVNGFRYSFVSAEVSAVGLTMRGYKSFNYKDALTPGIPKGTAPQGLGWTLGDYTASASFEIYRTEFEVFKSIVMARGLPGMGLGAIVWTFQVSYAEHMQPTLTDTLPLVRIKSLDNANTQGTDASAIKVELEVLEPIKWNGVFLVSKLEQQGGGL